MGFLFRPVVEKGSLVYPLPGPVTRFRVQDAWDYSQFKVPLLDGDTLTGHSRNGVDISIEGQFGSQNGTIRLSEEEMFAEYEAMRAALDVTSDDEEYLFYLSHNLVANEFRKYQKCTTVRFDADLSNKHLYTYSVVIHAADPVLYS